MTRTRPRRRRVGSSAELRIIGGRWRGRKLSFSAAAGLRPTPDRVRETLFNWLAPVIDGARCLDLFAGSGALGIEALSRGAAAVTFVERDRDAAARLRDNLQRLGVPPGGQNEAEVIAADAGRWLASLPPGPRYDIALLDPPFDAALLPSICERLAADDRLSPGALVYLESSHRRLDELSLPDFWTVLRDKRAGRVSYRLVQHPQD